METVQLWSLKIKDKSGVPQCIWDLCYSPNGSTIVVAAGNAVLVYQAEDGGLQKSLKGHKETVYCVDFSHDGKYFASGGADKCVIIWKALTLEGLLKYMHNDAVQCLAFNPATILLASCACSDFVFWTLDQKSVVKTKLSNRATCCSWKSDGQYLAIGLYNGVISVRNKATEEVIKIERTGSPIIWKIRWSYSKQEQNELLAVVDWNQKMSFYQLCGKQIIYGDGQSMQQLALVPKIGKDRHLGYDPCDLTWFGARNESVAVCGSNQQCILYSSEGNRLTQLMSQHSWIWCCRTRPGENQLVVGCQDGTLETIQILLPTVHSLYRDRYAYRESLTDVVVQHLITEQKARIKCRDYVKKIAVYKSRLAIQLSDKILIYEPATEDPTDMHYRVREKLIKDIECQLLVVTTHNLVICQENVLTSLNFQGTKEREWILDGPVRYIRIIGGPPTRETLLVGLKTGQVVKIILDNAFPVQMVKVLSGVRCVDISRNRDKVGVIDDNSTLSVYCLRTKELLFQEPNVISLAWNILNNDLLSYSGNDRISIKAGNFSSYSQHAKGVTVGFSGCYIYCLQENIIHRLEVSLAPAMYLYLEAGQLSKAREVACYGLTDPDCLALGQTALNKLNLQVAKYAFIQLGDTVLLTFIQQLEERYKRGEWSDGESIPSPGTLIALGDIAAHMGHFVEAANLYTKAGAEHGGTHRVVEMYTDLRRFDEAREAMTVGGGDSVERRQLLAKHADWARTTKEHRTATKMYMDAGEFAQAIELAGENRWTDLLLEISRKLSKADRDCLERCAQHLARLGEYAFAADCYAKYGDIENQLALHVEAKNWEEAFELVKKYPEHLEHVYLPYAQWLAENDKFEEAQAAFAKAGLQTEAIRVLEQLATCAANECRFEDAAFYHWKLSMQCLEMVKDAQDPKRQKALLTKFHELQKKADIYYVYSNIHRFLHEPFASQMPETYFNMARYLMHSLQNEDLNAVSKAAVLYVLARHGQNLGAYKLARTVYERLQNLHLPPEMREAVELSSLSVRTRPCVDSEDINVMCYRCSTTNPLLSSSGNRCINCKEPFVYSFISLEQLPLVEFIPEKGLSHDRVLELLRADPRMGTCGQQVRTPPKQNGDNGPQMLTISHGRGDLSNDQDRFTAKLLSSDLLSGAYAPVQLDADTLKTIPSSEVVVINHSPPLRPRYYKSVLPEVSITQCATCHKLFITDDYELAVLQRGYCPFCRTPRG